MKAAWNLIYRIVVPFTFLFFACGLSLNSCGPLAINGAKDTAQFASGGNTEIGDLAAKYVGLWARSASETYNAVWAFLPFNAGDLDTLSVYFSSASNFAQNNFVDLGFWIFLVGVVFLFMFFRNPRKMYRTIVDSIAGLFDGRYELRDLLTIGGILMAVVFGLMVFLNFGFWNFITSQFPVVLTIGLGLALYAAREQIKGWVFSTMFGAFLIFLIILAVGVGIGKANGIEVMNNMRSNFDIPIFYDILAIGVTISTAVNDMQLLTYGVIAIAAVIYLYNTQAEQGFGNGPAVPQKKAEGGHRGK